MKTTLLFALLLLFVQNICSQSLTLQSGSSTLNVGDLDVAGDKITVEALIYVPPGGGGTNVVSKHTHPGNVNYLLRPFTFEITTYISGNSGTTKFLQMFNPYKLSPNQWYHIAGTYDGKAVRYYVNGCLVIETPWTGNLYQNDLLTSIGNQSSCLCEPYTGNIDEVRVWNVCRSQAEIAANMLSLSHPTTQAGLKAYYKFSGNYQNEQGDTRWDGTTSGPITFLPDEAHLQKFAIVSVTSQEADCARSPSGTITITSTRPEAMYAVDNGNFQSGTTFSNLLPGRHRVYARSPEGCVLDTAVVVADKGLLLRKTVTASVCQGQSLFGYTAAGVYIDTLAGTLACDTVRTLHLAVIPVLRRLATAVICQDQFYTLPSGTVVNKPGTYQDTLRYSSGCDSVISTITLAVVAPATVTQSASVCPGVRFTLPWGTVASSAGVYRDTLRSAAGCDSVIRIVTLTVAPPAFESRDIAICANEEYTLPWGEVVRQNGLYRDTLRTSTGCDSLVRQVNLLVNPVPQLQVSKSNDVSCMLGTARLQATGGVSYEWSPQASLRNSFSSTPTASPSTTTTYRVMARSAEGCEAEGSITVNVVTGDPQKGYPVPNSFTPNGDGRNDCFGVTHWGAVSNFSFTVFNRYGEVVFRTTDVTRCWNGSIKGELQDGGVFVYLIKATTTCGPVERKGTVLLLR